MRVITCYCSLLLQLMLGSTLSLAQGTEKTPLNELLGTDELQVSGFIDGYFSYDFNDFDGSRSYLTQATRDREPSINLAFLDATLKTGQFRGRVAGQAGTSVDANYATEPRQFWRYVQEAFAGTKLAENLWLGAGIYLSHIGIESFISRDNWAYTRLLASDFSPYYQSGAKITWDPHSQLNIQLHYINGWQNISDYSGRSAGGTHIAYTFESGWNVAHNSFVGNEPEGTRIFNDFLLKSPLLGSIELGALFDIGDQHRAAGDHDQWYTWALLGRYHLSETVKISGRAEQYLDPKNVIVSTPNSEGFESVGFSFGVDIEVIKRLWWRSEYRAFASPNPIYMANESELKGSDHFVVTSLSYSF